jgi:hypothetical protein
MHLMQPICRGCAAVALGLAASLACTGCGDDGGSGGPAGSGGSGGGSTTTQTSGGGTTTGGGGASSGLAADYPGDVGIEAHPSVIFFEDFEVPDVAALAQRWDSVGDEGTFSLSSDVPAGAVGASQSLRMSGGGASAGTLYKSLPPQQDTVYVRYYAQYDDQSTYHHAGMWIGGFNPPTLWPQGTAGLRPSGSDFFQNAFEPTGGTLAMDHYAQWPGMDCFMEPGGCWGNALLRGAEPTVASGAWSCVELMLTLNTPGQSDGEYAVWIGDELVQHLRPGSPTFNRTGVGVWEPDPNGTPFPGFDWRSTPDLPFNWIWLDFYTDGPSTMSWDQVVVAGERIGCLAPAQ